MRTTQNAGASDGDAALKYVLQERNADSVSVRTRLSRFGKHTYRPAVCFDYGMRRALARGVMLIRDNRKVCMVMMPNGLTLELTYNEGNTYGVWLLGEHFLWWVVAGAA
jgi:hypothetical protein